MGILTLEVSGSMPWLGDERAHATRRPGVLVDLRSPKSLSAGRDHRMSEVYVKGKPLYPCVSFCTNHPGCQAEVIHLRHPPEDIRPFDEKMGMDPTFLYFFPAAQEVICATLCQNSSSTHPNQNIGAQHDVGNCTWQFHIQS